MNNLKRLSMKRVGEILGVDRATIVWLVDQGAPRNKDGTLDLIDLVAWLLGRLKED